MGRRQKKSPTINSQTRRGTPNTKEAKNEVSELRGHQDATATDEEQDEADLANDEATVTQAPLPEPATEGDAPTEGSVAGVEPDSLSETATDEVIEPTAPEPVVAEALSGSGSIEVETNVPVEEIVATSVEADQQAINETATDDATMQPTTAITEQAPAGDASATAQPEVDSATALALRRLREKPLCCCGCGGSLSGPKKHFLQGHDGKAKTIVRRIMRGEMKAEDAPPELILRHSEIKFIRLHPEFHSVVEAWRELCGVTPTNATK